MLLTCWAITSEVTNKINASPSIKTGVSITLIDVVSTELSIISRRTLAMEGTISIDTFSSILTYSGLLSTLINVVLTVAACVALVTETSKPILSRNTLAMVPTWVLPAVIAELTDTSSVTIVTHTMIQYTRAFQTCTFI